VIEPAHWGPSLAAEVASGSVPAGSVDLWRLGQSGFACRFGAATVLIDLYLSNHAEAVLPAPLDHRRLTRAPLDPAEITFGDIVICSHDHVDHLDVPTMRTLGRQLPGAVTVVPKGAVAHVGALGWGDGQIRGTLDGDTVHEHGLDVTAFAVAHEGFDEDPATGHPYQGYAVSDHQVTVAHLGDSVDHPQTRRSLQTLRPDVLLIPINGRSPARHALGFAGNTSAEEAVEVALAVGRPWVIPMHYDMFASNIDDDALVRFCRAASDADLPFTVLEVGQRWRYPAET
jgi:L-ascorbate 6-phosphate lactonase